jgi:hypothetical protein
MLDRRTELSVAWETSYFAAIDRSSSLALRLIAAESALMAALDHGSDDDVDHADRQYHAVRNALQDALVAVEYYSSDAERREFVEGNDA